MTIPSVFYTAKYGRAFAIPMLAYEFLGIEFNKEGVAEDEKRINEVYREVLEDICKVKFNAENLSELVKRSQGMATEAAEAEGRGPTKTKKGFTTSFYSYLLALPADKLILQACGNDYDTARNLYCVMDREDAMDIVSGYISRLQHDQGVMLEACAFGFGGEASGGGGGEENVVDMGNPETVKAAFNKLF